ncbi:glycoside hydrolase family 15 protein [Candidatus Nitronereus thalassa]|uniref:Glycoside hydrolase family 15 protein n=1 Tax=Candidatus Nitronereus thalassa TaxID=3020898 RepID=A0ABU3K2W5_9BACT|nr:glycoside hydrolase family 15 protein [Candidatus Nitronereus thalassa]MDT7040735.1 glycoside hydrolase family 15 protein [Candidatus Nitronereus thalassa]
MNKNSIAFGAPGIEPRWTSSAKDGIGTAYHSSACIWFTLSHGIINEIYFPHVDTPNTRDLQFLITDGESFCHEERRDLLHQTEYPEPNALLYRLTNADRAGRYRLVKEIVVDPHSSVLLMHTRLEVLDPKLRGKLRLYALLAPHMKGTGKNNSAWLCGLGGRKLIEAQREGVDLSFGCAPDFTRRSVGYVGFSDGWQDLMDNFTMDWEFDEAADGNIALIGEVDLSAGLEFTLGVGFGRSSQSACAHLLQALATPFADQREKYVRQWQRTCAKVDLSAHTKDGGSLMRVSQCLLLAHEDKIFQGAFVASLSIPWGDTKDDSDRGGYHLVWTRDMVQTATALLACGQTESPLRALIWLACVQAADGSLPQNSSIRGEPYWKGMQLDEVAVPILLAWRLQQADALRQFNPWTLVSRAARYLILHGPVTAQERWEENSGYSPSTLATIIASVVCTAEFARGRKDHLAADFLLDYADWLSAHLEDWMVTSRGELVQGKPRHYVRITPADPKQAMASPDPDHAELVIANGGGTHPARNIVGGDFLHLVRLGVRAADDPLIVDSLAVIDHVLKRDLPQGAGWRRYNHDGYGQKADGSAYDGTGEGRCWPILSGERAHYELAAGRDPMPIIEAMEKFANEGGMLSEQLWDDDDLPEGKMMRGSPTGAAMPLCWSHAEYVTLVRSHKDGVCFDRIEPVYQRYAKDGTGSTIEMWTLAHQSQRIAHGKTLRIITGKAVTIHWSADGWATANDLATRDAGFGCWFGDLPSAQLSAGVRIVFTIVWQEGWEGKDFQVEIAASNQTPITG